MREVRDGLDDRLPKVGAPRIGEAYSQPQFPMGPVHYFKPEHAKLPRFGANSFAGWGRCLIVSFWWHLLGTGWKIQRF